MKYLIFIWLFCFIHAISIAQEGVFREQLIAWGTANFDNPILTQFGLRYIPDFNCDTRLNKNITLNTNLSFNAYANTLLKGFDI